MYADVHLISLHEQVMLYISQIKQSLFNANKIPVLTCFHYFHFINMVQQINYEINFERNFKTCKTFYLQRTCTLGINEQLNIVVNCRLI